MKKTKQRILDTALDLFNKQGLSQVTLRTIANEMGISQGNLCYHYKKREEIIEALYRRLVTRIDQSMSPQLTDANIINQLFDLSEVIVQGFYEHRFFFLDFVQIMREHPKIRAHYLELSALRAKQFQFFFEALMVKGLMRKPELPQEYDHLYQRFRVLGDFWLSAAETAPPQSAKMAISSHLTALHQSIYPYLTQAGKTAYFDCVKTRSETN